MSEAERAYILDSEAINRLRKRPGLSWEKLAEQADVHITTLRAWRQGRPAFLTNIKKLADALNTEIKNIVTDWPGEPEHANPRSVTINPYTREYIIKIEENFSQWDLDKQNRLLELLRKLLGTGEEIMIAGHATGGCVQLRLRFTQEQADELEKAFDSGQLIGLKIIEIRPVSRGTQFPYGARTSDSKSESDPKENTAG